MASNQDWPFNIGVTPVGQQNQTQSILKQPLKQDLHSPTYHCGTEFSPSPKSTVYTYDLNCNNNSNDWLNAGCNNNSNEWLNNSSNEWLHAGCSNNSNDWLNAGCSKYMRQESVALDTSSRNWTSNPLYLQHATVIEAAWAYSSRSY